MSTLSPEVERRVTERLDMPIGDPRWGAAVDVVLGLHPRRRWFGVNDKRQPDPGGAQ